MSEIEDSSDDDASVENEFNDIYKAYCYCYGLLINKPSDRESLEETFSSLLFELGICLEKNDCIDDLILFYNKSLEIFPHNTRILNNYAAHLLRSGMPLNAITLLERALEVDKNFIAPARNLENAYSMAVDRWHFPMLNDRNRNQAFNQVIQKKIFQGYDTVLDIGTGTGLLSLYAFDAKAKKVYACDSCEVMYDIAKQVFFRNNATNIKLSCKDSSQLQIPQDIPERVKLIVAELFDAALFGELVVPTLIDAHERLLAKDGIIIPMCATLFITAVECEYIRFRSSALYGQSQQLGCLNFENIVVLTDENHYDTENLKNIHVNYITEPVSIVKINFNNLEELKNFNVDGIKNVISTKCRYDGIIDGLVAWFKLELDEEISLDSSQGESCWQLVVFPTCPQNVKFNDEITITAEICNGILKCSYNINNKSIDLSENLVLRLPKQVITFLNDKQYITALIHQAQLKKDENISTVIDTSPFPVYGLTLLKENVNCKTLYYQTDNEESKHFIQCIADKNNINKNIYFTSTFNEIDSHCCSIYLHCFDTKGELLDFGEKSYCQIFSHLLISNNALLPEKIYLYGQLVFSEELPKIVSVKDDNLQKIISSQDMAIKSADISNVDMTNTQELVKSIESPSLKNNKYIIAEYINKFKINQVFDLNSSLYTFTPLSEPMQLTEMNGPETKKTIINFGKINTKKYNFFPNALICWYKIFLNGHGYETRRNDSFMNHMAVVFENEIQDKVTRGDDVKILIDQEHDLVRISTV